MTKNITRPRPGTTIMHHNLFSLGLICMTFFIMIAGIVGYAHATVIINEVKPGLPILPLTISDSSKAFVGSITFFINSTDGHYHLKGIVRNTLPEVVYIPVVGIDFFDQASGRNVAGATNDLNYTRVSPVAMQHFDIDTGYNITRAAKEFQYMNGIVKGP